MGKTELDKEEVETLVDQAKNGDSEAFGEIYDFYVDAIYRYIFFKVGKEDALDLTENVFLKVWEKLRTYKRGKSYFSSWLFRVAHNTIVDHYRMRKAYTELDTNVPDDKRQNDPVIMTEQNLSHETLQLAIKKLKKKYQQIIILKYINELENDQIARIMKRSEGNLRILKFRALKALKQILEEMNVHY